MSTEAFGSMRDKTGAERMLDLLELSLEFVPFDQGAEHCALAVVPEGLWLLVERDGGKPAAIHDLFFTPFEFIEDVALEMSDDARNSAVAAGQLSGTRLSITEKDLDGNLGIRSIDGRDLVSMGHRSGSSSQYLRIIVDIAKSAASAGVPVSVSIGK